jgi:hypothetical protein
MKPDDVFGIIFGIGLLLGGLVYVSSNRHPPPRNNQAWRRIGDHDMDRFNPIHAPVEVPDADSEQPDAVGETYAEGIKSKKHKKLIKNRKTKKHRNSKKQRK